ADEVRESIHRFGTQAYAFEADLSDAAAIPAIFDRAEATLGPVQVLVNNAAYWEGDTYLPSSVALGNAPAELWTERPDRITAASYERIFTVNTRAPALMIAEFAHRHIERGAQWGRIINISTDGAQCFPSEVTYGASKFALESYTRSAASELGKF